MSRTLYTLLFIVLGVFLSGTPRASAFELSHYTEQSALASGYWVKIGVDRSGLHLLTPAALRQMGFSDPAKVRVHGYGGRRIADVMAEVSYVDDLPEVLSEYTTAGLVFYGAGPEELVEDDGLHYDLNPYTSWGYYYLTQSDAERPEVPATGSGDVSDRTYLYPYGNAIVQHEDELVQACESGPLFVGDDFRYTKSRTYTLSVPGYNSSPYMQCRFFANIDAQATLSFTVNGTALESNTTDRVERTSTSSYVHGSIGVASHQLDIDGENVRIGVTFSGGGQVTSAHLDYIALQYDIVLDLARDGSICFFGSENGYSMDGATAETRLWDVTEPANVRPVNYSLDGAKARWMPTVRGRRMYAAWNPGAKMLTPRSFGKVANQNLHAPLTTPEMVIFTTQALNSQAERIAELHRKTDGMEVDVVNVDQMYNEFSSGSPDVSAYRKYLKMVYDRGNAAGKPLRYALLLGRPTLDHRLINTTSGAASYATMPSWVVRRGRQSLSDNDGYATDDFIAMLQDNSGGDMGLDDISVAVGRIPMTTSHEGDEIIDKLYQYVQTAKRTGWKNKLLMLADDGDLGVHLRQTEVTVANMEATPLQQHLIKKVYMDSYELIGGEYPQARTEMFRYLDEGVVWWYFVGHANNHSWTGEHQLTYTDINNMYLRYVPFVVASTCDFLRWDSPVMSGGEIMYKERNGGAIGMISATRPVYISDNGMFLAALGRATLSRGDDGRMLSSGQIYQRAKNDILSSDGVRRTNTNRLRFVFMGDPAMRLSTPDNIVEVSTIDGIDVNSDEQITIPAMAQVTVTGRVVNPAGEEMTDFNGVVSLELFDAERSITTRANGESGSHEVYETNGDKLFTGSAPVRGGQFSITIAMPSMIADNFRPAAISCYAYSTDNNDEAIGVYRDFYVYGYREPESPDTEAPVIESMVLNHSGFESGQTVNTSPMLIAHVSDNLGLNLSTTTIGHQMVLTLDERESITDVPYFFTPDPTGEPGGTINYPMENLSVGNHSLRLRVYDTSGNAASRTIEFNVAEGLAPQIFEVFTDANPASSSANFYVRHDRPESVTTVTVEVFDLMGRPIWSSASKGTSDMDVSAPVTWDLTDRAGRRVNRGIYLYRASITADGERFETSSRRIAVTAP